MSPHAEHRPTVPEVMPLATAYYRFPGCGVGGCLHIVLDDENIEDGHIQYCIECARDPEFWVTREHYNGYDEAGELLGRLLLLMSPTQRSKISERHDGYGDGDTMDRPTFIERARALLAKYSGVAEGTQP